MVLGNFHRSYLKVQFTKNNSIQMAVQANYTSTFFRCLFGYQLFEVITNVDNVTSELYPFFLFQLLQ